MRLPAASKLSLASITNPRRHPSILAPPVRCVSMNLRQLLLLRSSSCPKLSGGRPGCPTAYTTEAERFERRCSKVVPSMAGQPNSLRIASTAFW